LGLSNTDIGLVTGGYAFVSAISQPFFGWLIDRVGPQWIASGGLFWTAGCISIALLLQNTASLPLLIIAGFGSGAFHPAGTMEATRRGHEYFAGRAATAASIFFLFGQAAYTIGPAIGGLLLERFSSPGLLLLSIFAIPVGVNAIIRLRPISPAPEENNQTHSPPREIERELHSGWLALAAFSLLIALRSWAYGNMAAFLPKFLLDGGIDLSLVGILTALYMGGSALGNVVGGALSDRWGKRLIIFASLLLASISMYGFVLSGISSWMYIVIPLFGIFIGASQSPVVVIAQSLMPNRMATASGLILGFMFSTEAMGIYVSGLIADASSLKTVFTIGPGLAIIATLLTLTLKGRALKGNSAI
jgi:FSR family fosmidomycin resistance protein-like MFS transporter